MTSPNALGLQPVFPFAAPATYPAGSQPWSATATNDQPGYPYFTPGVPPAAQEMNYLLQDNKNDAQNLQNILGHIVANGWSPEFVVGSGSHAAASNQNPEAPVWAVAMNNSGVVEVYTRYMNDHAGWAPFSSGSPTLPGSATSVASVLYLSNGAMWVSYLNSSGAIVTYSGTGGAWSLLSTYASAFANSPLGVTDLTIGTPLLVQAVAKTPASLLQVSTNFGGSWSTITAVDAAPTGWILANNAGNEGVSVGAYAFIAMPQAANDSYWSYGGGGVGNWVARNMVTAGINASAIPSAMTFGYGLNGPCWYLAATLGSAGQLYQSYDSVNFTLIATLPDPIQTMCSVGSWLMITLYFVSPNNTLFYANMVTAPKTWYLSNVANLGGNTGPAQLYSAYGQTLILSPAACRFGTAYGSASGFIAT
jgi:hypothetical protein